MRTANSVAAHKARHSDLGILPQKYAASIFDYISKDAIISLSLSLSIPLSISLSTYKPSSRGYNNPNYPTT